MTKQRRARRYAGGPLMLELEPRILLSADLPALADYADIADDENLAHAAVPVASTADEILAPDGAAEASETRELVIVDAATPNAQLLLEDLLAQANDGRSLEVVVLDADRDGIDQVSSLLADRSDIDALHIISHGRDGSLLLGANAVDNDELVTRAASIRGWGDAFTADADILIYGCNLAAGPEGRTFVDALARLTDTDVAASDDLTGDAGLSGDWDLEYRRGTIEAGLAVSAAAQSDFDAVLTETQYLANQSADGELEIRGNQNWGQTFEYTSGSGTYEVNFIDLQLRRDPNGNPKNLVVEIRDSWNGAVLASGSFDGDDLSTSMQWARINLGAVELNDGQTYTIRVDASNSGGRVYVASDSSGGYADGTRLDTSGAPVAGEDLAFRIGQVINDAPVNTVPLAQNMLQDTTLTFSVSNGNAISVSDDAGATDELVVTLGVNDGTLSLSQTAGLTFSDGDGVADATMTFSGTQVDINAALEGMTYTPTASWSGVDTLTITTNDQGNPSTATLDAHESLAAGYSFDVDGSNVTGNQDATLYNGASIVADPERGNVLETDGVDDYASVPGGVTAGLSEFTFSFWVRTSESGSTGLHFTSPTLFGMESLGFGSNDLVINTDNGYIGFYTGLSGSEEVYLSSTTRINDDQWHLITLSNDGANASLYVDGAFEASLATGGALDGFSYFIGAQSIMGLPAWGHSGRYDDVRIFDRALTATEVSALYGLSDTDQINITVTWDVTAPVVTVDALTTSDATPQLTGTVDDAAAVIQVTVDGNTYAAVNNGDGTWTLADDTITPALADGTYDVSVTATDGVGNVGTDATANELVVDANAPVVTVDALTTSDATPQLTGTVDDAAAVIQVTVDGNTYAAVNNGDGTWTLADDTITPALADGTYDVSVTATDGVGNVGTDATANELVVDTNIAPVASDDAYAIPRGGSLVTVGGVDDLLRNDFDANGDPLSVNTTPVVGPSNGTLALNADGTFTYTPDPTFTGVDAFTYEISDGAGAVAQAIVTITVIPVNRGPAPAADNYTISEDGNLLVDASAGVLNNDIDADGDPLIVNPSAVVGPTDGVLILADDGSFTYSPDADFNGRDSFVYQVDDGNGGLAQTTVTIDVTPVNDAPVGGTDNLSVSNSAPLAISSATMLQNDSDPDGDALTIVSVSGPTVGSLVDQGNGNYVYTASADFEGTDRFSYTVADPGGATATVFVFVDVTPGAGGWLGGEEPADDPTDPDDQPPAPETETTQSGAASPAEEPADPTNQISQADVPPGIEQLAAIGDAATVGEFTLRQQANDVIWIEPAAIADFVQQEDQDDSDGGPARAFVDRISALAQGFEFEGFGIRNVSFNQEALWDALDTMNREIRNLGGDSEQGAATVITQVAAGTSLALSAGFISWVLRGGALASTLLTTMPMWKGFDPLPLLAARRRHKDEDRQRMDETVDGTWSSTIKAERIFHDPRPEASDPVDKGNAS